MKDFRAIFCDIDDTLTEDSSMEFSPLVLNVIKQLIDRGVMFIPTTGRSLAQIPDCLKETGISYLILTAGSKIYDVKNDVELFSSTISKDVFARFIELSDEYDTAYNTTFDDHTYMDRKYEYRVTHDERFSNWHFIPEYQDELSKLVLTKAQKIQKFEFFPVTIELKDILVDRCRKIDGELLITGSEARNIEIAGAGASKDKAMLYMCEMMNIEQNECIGIGDSNNDVGMLKRCGLKLVMENGMSEPKAIADKIIEPYYLDGVAKELIRIFDL